MQLIAAAKSLLNMNIKGNFEATLWRHRWCHHHAKNLYGHNLERSFHIWGQIEVLFHVHVMFHALMTSLMTSQDHKVGQILKLIHLRQYLNYRVDQKLKMSEMLKAIFLVYSTFGTSSVKKFVASSKWRPFWKFWNIKHSFNLTSDMKRSSQIMPENIFMIQGGLKVGPLYSFMN